LLTINAFTRKALDNGVDFHFNERATTLLVEKGRMVGIETDKRQYRVPVGVDAVRVSC
jgi:glycine/D-amino acid oxidase-like deaminating enzyme